MADALLKIAAKTAAEVCKNFALSDDARPLLKEGMSPEQFLVALQAKECFADAMRFLAQALPKPDAVFWAYKIGRAHV